MPCNTNVIRVSFLCPCVTAYPPPRTGPLKDFNENRLSTFECALLWTKVCEDFLDDDIKLNWVQIFRDQEPVMPIFEDEDAVKSMVQEEESSLKGKLERMKDWVIESVHDAWESQHPEASNDLLYLAPMDAGLIKKFGHDGKGTFAEVDSNPGGPLTIKTADADGLGSSAKIFLMGEGEKMLDAWALEGGKHKAARSLAVQCVKREWRDNCEEKEDEEDQVSAEVGK